MTPDLIARIRGVHPALDEIDVELDAITHSLDGTVDHVPTVTRAVDRNGNKVRLTATQEDRVAWLAALGTNGEFPINLTNMTHVDGRAA